MSIKSRKIIKHLSHSILLKESGSPALLRIVLIFFTLIIAFFIYWANNIQLNQVVITSGEILTKDDISKIQHPQGGIVKQILVKDGALVEKDQIILTFDDVVISGQIKEEIAKISTLNIRLKTIKGRT